MTGTPAGVATAGCTDERGLTSGTSEASAVQSPGSCILSRGGRRRIAASTQAYEMARDGNGKW
jgi:hypothetical protein